ncbi:Putative xanthine dehydrogenase, XdhB subunit [Oleispira antarctica RB-8]|uniref:Putative xanthine dehydrogenase, XdhB subunit n=1 Tax=Oleispira antarctica RB-8 TaxID=698738 RepID=R4YU09_OLEAN|nr:Putative xanthine dehydrogenase, XdhB subunit [Oleispira antarctica RB-8]
MRKLIDTHHSKNPEQALKNEQRTRPGKVKSKGQTGQSMKHDSAEKHVTGKAVYVDDMPEYPNQLHIAVGGSAYAHAKIKSIDLTSVRETLGVVDVITVHDVPGHVDIGPVFSGDPVLVEELCEYVGQPIFAVAANTMEIAKAAVAKASIEYDVLEPTLNVEKALADKFFVRPTHQHVRGDSAKALAAAPHRIQGQQHVNGQEHFYLEGQVCSVLPTEDGGMTVYSSTQHPTEVQKLVAEVLDISINKVKVEIRRMGGGFGGKETQAAPLACIAAIVANKTGRPVKYRMSRTDDMVMTGKRHPFFNRYDVGFDDQGIMLGSDIMVAGNCGNSPDLSDAIVDRAMFHSDNAYYLNNATVTGHRCKTHTISNTAYRGFGGPQGVILAELMMDDIARHLGEDPLTIRKRNLYGIKHDHIRTAAGEVDPRNQTHYGQTVEQKVLPELIEELEQTSNYWQRREEIKQFNANSPFLKKGLSLTPVKFGISFTVQFLNQAGALVHIYTDGSIHLNHGGTEMGQGLFVKVAQVVAEEFQVDLDTIQVSATNTEKVPNTSPTAASSGTDLNGMAARDACLRIKAGMLTFAAEHYGAAEENIYFDDNHLVVIKDSDKESASEEKLRIPFADFVQQAYMGRVPLSSTGFYKTPKIHYDRETGKGRPFYYYANGASVSEVLVDTLTGESRLVRTDILHDVGRSLNPAIDKGQIEGAFIQGMGWLTTEELKWNDQGRLLSNGPATYKIPAVGDTPFEFNVNLLEDRPNREETIYRSKAVGEPPFMLGISVWSAIRDAVASLADYNYSAPMDTPATPEEILKSVHNTKDFMRNKNAIAKGQKV